MCIDIIIFLRITFKGFCLKIEFIGSKFGSGKGFKQRKTLSPS